ncbi:hypothetical protein [Frankia sp. EI5c]|uniref:hypothetical protein n=1 Tax=Frankia sp. EI5c TaxID=683316 RepID=UPI001F5B8115|nr:hypothetical protein [Frankia sp. EI5c]
MVDETRQDNVTRDACRAIMIDGIPVSLFGAVALALGSSPDQSTTEKGWWLGVTGAFTLAIVWVLVRAFRRADEYQRKIQMESMAIAFAAVLVGLQTAVLLDATDVVALRTLSEVIVIGGVGIWFALADLRTRLHR